MTVAASGRLSLPIDYLINTLAGSTTFQTEVGAANAAAAKGKIYEGGLDEDDTNAPPRAIVRLGQGQNASRKSTDSWELTGPLELLITLNKPSGLDDNYPDAWKTMLNKFGAIRDEMLLLVQTDPGAGPYLDITSFPLDYFGQWEKDLDGSDAYWDAVFTVNWRGM